MRTLRRRLLLALGVPLLALLAFSMWLDYRTAALLADDINDHNLNAVAVTLAEHLEESGGGQEIELEVPEINPLTDDSPIPDQTAFALVATSGRLIAGDPAMAALADSAGTADGRHHDALFQGRMFRVASYRAHLSREEATLAVAQTTASRDAAIMPIFMRSLWPNILQLFTTLAIIYYGVQRSLRPLATLGARIAEHPVTDLQPLSMHDVPDEVAPLVESINQLIGDLRHKGESQQALLANASHQLRTPLTRLQTQLELLADTLGEDARQRFVPLMETSRQLSHFTHQMLVLARSARDADLFHEFQPTDLAALLEEAASHFLDAALAKDIDLGFEPATAVVPGSAWLLRELLANLLDNAIVYAPVAGHVTARCGTQVSGEVILEVEDDGPVIAPEVRERIFERFVRGADTGTPGTGLGLAIVAEIAKRHGAEVRLIQNYSTGIGKRFQVVFPTPRRGHRHAEA